MIGSNCEIYYSQARSVQLAMIHIDNMTTRRTVPGQIVIRVLSTKRVLKLILFSAPMLRDEASVNSLLWSSITRQMRYSRRNIGRVSSRSMGTCTEMGISSDWTEYHPKWKAPGIGWTAHSTSSTASWTDRLADIAMRQSSIQLSTANS